MTTKQSSIVFGSALLVATSVSGCIVRTEKERVAAPPPPSTTAVVVQPTQRVVTYPEGRWQLYGDGTGGAPLYWAWVPAGTNPPPPPPLPRTP